MAEYLRSELQLEWQGQLTDLVTALAWSPTGRSWAASSANGEIVWLPDPAELSSPSEHPSQMLVLQAANGASTDCLAFSADARWLAAGGQAGQLRIWNCDRRNLPPQLVSTIELHTWIDRLVWHPTLPQLAIGYGPQVKIWDAATASEMTTWRFDKSSVFDLAWHPSGEYLAIAGYKGVEICRTADWLAPSHKLTQSDAAMPVQGHVSLTVDTASIQICWSPDGRYLAAGNLDRSLTIMDWHNPEDPWILQGCPGKIRKLAWLDRSATPCLAVATGTAVALWNLNTDDWTGQLLEGHQGVVAAIAACPNRPMFMSAATDGNACLWTAEGEIDQIITNTLSGFTALAWHPRHSYLAAGTQIGEIGLWLSSA